MKILFLSQLFDTDDPRRLPQEGLPPFPDEKLLMPSVFEELGVQIVVIDAAREPLPEPEGFDGVIVGGSLGSANDREPWRVDLERWLLKWQNVPLLGICGGHQLLARALGGTVAVMPQRQVGVCPLQLPGIPAFRSAIQLHQETVVTLPEGAELWASDEFGVQALKYGPTRWTVQFHPEATAMEIRQGGQRMGVWDWSGLEEAIMDGRKLLVAWLDQVRAGRSEEGR